ncbi:hypothetical protein FI667_g7862, partial [Globisporangium splendens]
MVPSTLTISSIAPEALVEWMQLGAEYVGKMHAQCQKSGENPEVLTECVRNSFSESLLETLCEVEWGVDVSDVTGLVTRRTLCVVPNRELFRRRKLCEVSLVQMSSIDSDAVDYESSSEEVTPCNSPASSTTTNVVRDDREEEAESSSVDRSNLKRNEANRPSSAVLLNEPSRKKRREEGSPHGETSGSTVAVAIFDDGASESEATVEDLGRGGLASADPDLVNAARNILLSLDASNCKLEAVDPLEDLLFDVDSESDAQVSASSGNSELPRYLALPAKPKDPATGPSQGKDFIPSSWSHLWTPKPNWIHAHRGTQRAGTHALYDVGTIKDDDFVLRQNFHPKAREELYIDLFHSMRYFDGRSKSKKSHSAEKQALFLSQAWSAFVANFNEDAAKCISRLRDNRVMGYT